MIYFFDIDNTLLDHRTHTVLQSALEAVNRLKQTGHYIAIATGRSYEHAAPHIAGIAPDYVIAYNGALILKDSQPVFTCPLPRDRLVSLFEWIQEAGHSFGVNHGADAYISEPVQSALEPMHSVRLPVQWEDPFYLREAVYQGWFFFDQRLDAKLFPQIRQRYPEFDLVRWHQSGTDILHRHINKWTACQWVLQQMDMTPDQAIAFGDGLNDIQMIRGVGLGIAMGNAHPELKAAADRITAPLNEDGIANMLKILAQEGSH